MSDGKLWIVTAFAAVAFLAVCLLHTINSPWVEEDNVFGAAYAQAACTLRAGLTVTAGVPPPLRGPLPIPPDAYYVHHPVLVPLQMTTAVAVLGEKEWVVRLVPICSSILSALFLWFLVAETINTRAAAFVVVFFAMLPIELHYGDLVDYEPLLVMWMLAALVCLRNSETRGGRRWIILAGVCCLGAVWTDWPGYLFTFSVAISFLLKKDKTSRRFAMVLLGIGAVSLLLFLLPLVNPGMARFGPRNASE